MAAHPVDLSGLMSRAHRFAERNHVDERRLDYLHKVREILAGAQVTDPTTLLAPVMREVLESTSTPPFEIEEKFGPKVLKLTMELTVDRKLDEATRRAVQLARAPTLSNPATVVLLADIIANLGTLRADRTLKENHDYIDWAENLAEAVSGINSHLDGRCDEMVDHARDLADAARGNWPPTGRGRKPSKPKEKQLDRTFLRIDAERGVRSVEITWQDCIADVTIDGTQLLLPEVSGHALSVAAFFSKPGEDGLPLLIDRKAFGRELGRRTGGTYEDPHHIRMVIYRLRRKLSQNGVNPWLVEMLPGSVRFRWRRPAPKPSPVPEPELATVS